MIKQIKKWGKSLVIRFSPEECKAYELKEGIMYEVELVEFKKLVKGGKRK